MKFQKDKIDTVIFDMDGVITSELSYWQAAALTVYELLYDYRYFGKREIDRAWCIKNLKTIYEIVFCGGKTVTAVKNCGVNTNWDLAYVVFCVAKYLDTENETFDRDYFESVCMFLENTESYPPELYDLLAGLLDTVLPKEEGYYKRGDSPFWRLLVDCFQRWYHGNEEAEGLKETEEPLLPLAEIKDTLKALKDAGLRLGIGTGRPRDEIEGPMKRWGLDVYFDPDCCVTYQEVLNAQEELGLDYPLAKPHPFVFLKAAFGNQYSDKDICDAKIKKEQASHCLVVGDAASDLLAAKAGGFPFLAVLTGAAGMRGKAFFEEQNADWILESVLDLKQW